MWGSADSWQEGVAAGEVGYTGSMPGVTADTQAAGRQYAIEPDVRIMIIAISCNVSELQPLPLPPVHPVPAHAQWHPPAAAGGLQQAGGVAQLQL